MSSARANRKSLLARAKVLFARARATLSRPGRPAQLFDLVGREARTFVAQFGYLRKATCEENTLILTIGTYRGIVWKLPEPRECGRASRRFSGMIQMALTNMAKRRLGSFSHRQPWGNSAVKGIGPGKLAVRTGCLYIFGRALRWQGLRLTERLPQALPHSLGSGSFQTVPGSLPIVNTNL
ncbi:hypothetical protein BJ912DRAFT_935969 [Pholiota molesta]|nr:hypothetical protein BJ912DRAFT_935969 [Pholiota molesta]